MGTHPEGRLADLLISCGVDPEDVHVERDEPCQEDVLTFSAPRLPQATLVSLAELHLTFPSRFVFASGALNDAFRRIVSQSPGMVALRDQLHGQRQEWLRTRGLSAFEPFDPRKESVSDFAARVEAACGARRGELLSAQGEEAIRIHPKEPGTLTLDEFRTLAAVLETFAPDLPCFVDGEDRE